jgi:hypothetical protein
MSDPAPTFADNRDRITYLLAEYKVPIALVVVAGMIWMAAFTPSIPEPPEALLAGTAAAGLLAFPAFFLAKVVVGWFDTFDGYRVGVSHPGTEPIHQVWKVPSEIWDAAEIDDARPYPDVDGVDYVVTSFEWVEDIEQLRVRGVDRAEMQPAEAWASADRVDEYYTHYLGTLRSYASLKSRVGKKVTETHDSTIMQMLGERESAELSPGVDVTDLIEEIESDEEDELPEPPGEYEDELPGPDMGMGEPEAIADGGHHE